VLSLDGLVISCRRGKRQVRCAVIGWPCHLSQQVAAGDCGDLYLFWFVSGGESYCAPFGPTFQRYGAVLSSSKAKM
jgi:hypothetical protein